MGRRMSAENFVIKTILNRKSVRQFLDKPVEQSKIDLVLRAGMSAPSARNRQPWKFVVVDEKDLLIKMKNFSHNWVLMQPC